MADRVLLVLLGDTDERLDRYDVVVTWCPIRHRALARAGIRAALFGDFTPGPERGRSLDLALHEQLEDCLQRAAERHSSLRWVPLAVQQVKWPLARYRWLKACARNVFQTFPVQRCVISSRGDADIARAIQAVADECGVRVEIRDGAFDGTSNILYREVPYGLPTHLDPWWFFRLHWWVVRAWRRRTTTLIERYPNIRHAAFAPSQLLFSLDRSLALLHTAWVKALRTLGLFSRGVVVWIETDVDARSIPIDRTSWESFPADEHAIIQRALAAFSAHYPPAALDDLARRIAFLLSTISPSRLVLAVDQLDADRLLTAIAKRHRIPVEYLPHGLLYEHYSGAHRPSPFVPDRVWAWNDGSQRAFRRLGWDVERVQHPVNQRAVAPLRRPPSDCRQWEVLVMIPEWVTVSQGGREDCAIHDLIHAYGGLTGMGVPASHIHVQYHGVSGVREVRASKEIHLERLQRLLAVQFRVLDSTVPVRTIMEQYDLILIGPTTGIFEAVLRGAPVVLFGEGFEYIGALEGYPLPRARTAHELPEAVAAYRGGTMEGTYAHLARSLQSGVPLAALS